MGEQADYLIDQMIWDEHDFDEFGEFHGWGSRPVYRKLPANKTATRVAEDLLKDEKQMKQVKDLNKGVIKW